MKIERIECVDRRTARRRAPWATRITRVHGGYIAFESIVDFINWRRKHEARTKIS